MRGIQVFEREGGFIDVFVPTEHEDFLRKDVRAIVTLRRVGGYWQTAVDESSIRFNPEAVHACLGVALRYVAAQFDGTNAPEKMGP